MDDRTYSNVVSLTDMMSNKCRILVIVRDSPQLDSVCLGEEEKTDVLELVRRYLQ
jgi:hypothetical protein